MLVSEFYLQQQDDLYIGQQHAIQFYILLQEANLLADQIEVQLPQTILLEESSFTAVVYFRNRVSQTPSTPTTIHYRIDCLTTLSTKDLISLRFWGMGRGLAKASDRCLNIVARFCVCYRRFDFIINI